MDKHSLSVSEALASTGARLIRAGAAGRGLPLAEWSNRDNRARYDRPGHHTLSIYLAGGERVLREDRGLLGGAPEKLRLLPAGHESRWRIGGPLRMVHLHIDPEVLAYQALAAFDMDTRRIDLMDLTFVDDPAVAMVVRGGLSPFARRRIIEHIEAHLDEPLTLDRLARQSGLSTFHFAKVFKTALGIIPSERRKLR